MNKVKAAVIGLGKIGYEWEYDQLRMKPATHFGAYMAHREVDLVGVVDIDDRKRADFSERFPRIPVYANHEDMLYKEKPEIVSVCTPVQTHLEIVRDIIRYDGVKGIFCEKPIAPTVAQAEEMIRRCEMFNIKLAINHTRRWDDYWRWVYRVLNEWAVLISVQSMVCCMSGDILDVGVHMADLVNWLKPPTATLWFIPVPVKYLIFEVDFLGEQGRLRITDNGHSVKLYSATKSKHYEGIFELEESNKTPGSRRAPLLNAADDLLQCLQSGKAPECTGKDGLAALELALSWKEQLCLT